MPAQHSRVQDYLGALPDDRRRAIRKVRAAVNRGLPRGYQEGMQYGMIGWFVPHRLYPDGYHCDPSQPVPFASLGSQKNHMALYLMCIYGNDEHRAWFEKAWKGTGLRLDMGRSCVRFRKVEEVPLDLITEAIARVPVEEFLADYRAATSRSRPGRSRKKS